MSGNFIDRQFYDRRACETVAGDIRRISKRPVTLMEVCGGHTHAIQRFGIASLLPSGIRLVSGPGCPVCVSDKRFIDRAIALSRLADVVIATFGDLIRVPGSTSSLEKERSRGADVRIVYSSADAVTLALKEPAKRVVFLGIGFETTTPTTAAAILDAQAKGIRNFFVVSAHKIMPPAMAALIDEGIAIDGYICPGHVSVVTGPAIYTPIAQRYKKPCVISGFQPLDILLSIRMLVAQIERGAAMVENEYSRAVRPGGNPEARQCMQQVFELRDDTWRGLGTIPASGCGIREEFRRFDAEACLDVDVEPTRGGAGCICGDILKGLKTPHDCPLFAAPCTPAEPVGACMVSNEGTCAAYYKYNRCAEKTPA